MPFAFAMEVRLDIRRRTRVVSWSTNDQKHRGGVAKMDREIGVTELSSAAGSARANRCPRSATHFTLRSLPRYTHSYASHSSAHLGADKIVRMARHRRSARTVQRDQ